MGQKKIPFSFFIIILVILLANTAKSQLIRVGLFNDKLVETAVFTVIEGNYLLMGDNQPLLTIASKSNLYISSVADSINLAIINRFIGRFAKVSIQSMAEGGVFSYHPVIPALSNRFFDDNLELWVSYKRLNAVNIVDIEKYLAGVVEAEGGPKASPEFYKSQSVLCRTYVLNHLNRHIDEKFFLCDAVHCQAFHGRNEANPLILEYTRQTSGEVVVDSDTLLITAAFHSNCGGETENADNIWLIEKKYLKSVKDPYCQNQRNWKWEKKLPVNEWKNYLHQNKFNITPDQSGSYFNFIQFARKKFYVISSDTITFKKIRADLSLKSAFFSVQFEGNNIILKGRGYGHGIGMCQEGAMQMSLLGYNYNEIVKFYYKHTRVVDYKQISVTKNPSIKLITPKNW